MRPWPKRRGWPGSKGVMRQVTTLILSSQLCSTLCRPASKLGVAWWRFFWSQKCSKYTWRPKAPHYRHHQCFGNFENHWTRWLRKTQMVRIWEPSTNYWYFKVWNSCSADQACFKLFMKFIFWRLLSEMKRKKAFSHFPKILFCCCWTRSMVL